MKLGFDGLFANEYTNDYIKAAYPGDVFGYFMRTNGDGRKSFKRIVSSRKFSEGVTHLAPFDRNHRYELKKYLPQVYKDAAFCEEQAKANPGTIVMISPFCEHNHNRGTMQPVFAELKRIAPSCLLVNSIWKGEEVPGTITEIHIEAVEKMPPVPKNEYVIAFDGFGGDKRYPYAMVDCNMAKVLAKYSTARHARAWGARANLKWDAIEDTTAIGKRNKKPSVQYMRGYRNTLRTRTGAISYSDKNLLKTFADDHGAKEPTKDNRLMVIIGEAKAGEKAADVYDIKGNKIDTMARVKPDHTGKPKGRRYYSKKYATEVAEKAVKNTGSPLIQIRSGEVKLPYTDGFLRSKPRN